MDVPRNVHIRYYVIYIPHYNSITCVTNLVHVIYILYTSVGNMLYDIFERPQRPKILSTVKSTPLDPPLLRCETQKSLIFKLRHVPAAHV